MRKPPLPAGIYNIGTRRERVLVYIGSIDRWAENAVDCAHHRKRFAMQSDGSVASRIPKVSGPSTRVEYLSYLTVGVW